MGRLLAAMALAAGLAAQTGEQPDVNQLQRRLEIQRHLLVDWAGLNHYGSEDTEVPKPKPGENRVVFLGDQITERWGKGHAPFFPGKPYFNRGIPDQTAPQMLIRFRQDVIDLHPKAVVILGGLNDIAGLHGASTEEMILDNLTSMTQLAQANGIGVVLASLTPVCNCFGKNGARERWQERISEANELIEKYCTASGATFLDYYSAMANRDDLKKELTDDGVLPNDAGYRVMARLAGQAIAAALKAERHEAK